MKEDIEQSGIAEAVPAVEAPLPNTFEPALCSIQDVVRAASAGWHKVYEAGNHCFAVHMDFLLPKAPTMPVLTVRWGEDMLENQDLEDCDEAESYGFGFIKNSPRAEDAVYDYVHLSVPWNFTQAYLGKDAVSLGDAVTFIQDKVEAFSEGRVQIAPDAITVVSPGKRRKTERDRPPAKPYYHIQFRQLLSGIPILGSVAMTLHPSVPEKGSGYPMPAACVASEEEYCAGTSYMVEEERVCEDVLLCPFSTMLKKWEWLVLAGHVENIDRIRLGYVLYMDREDQARIWAVPSWVMRCIYHKTPKESEEGSSRWREIIFNAQTGDMLEVDSHDPDLIYRPPIFRRACPPH